MTRLLLTIAAISLISIASLQAHHSLSGVYDMGKEITVSGSVAKFHFVNPHPFVTLTTAENGKSRQWRLELDNRFELSEIGVTEDTLKPGDRIVVSGHPGHSQAQSLYVRRLDRPRDGFRYEQVGSTPRISPAAR